MEIKLLELINDVLGNANLSKLRELNDDLDLRDDLGFDSFMLAELTVKIEDEFDIDIFEGSFVRKIGEIRLKLS